MTPRWLLAGLAAFVAVRRGAAARAAARRGAEEAEEGAAPRRAEEAAKRWRERRRGALSTEAPVDVVRHVLSFVPRPPLALWSVGRIGITVLHPEGVRMLPALHGNASRAELLPDGRRFVTAHSGGKVVVWDTKTNSVRLVLHHSLWGARTSIFDLQVFPDGDRLVTLGSDRRVVIWHAATGEALWQIALSGPSNHSVVRVLLGGAQLATGVSLVTGDPAMIWGVAKRRALHALQVPGDADIRALEASPCGTRVVTVSRGAVLIWSAATGRLARALSGTPSAAWVSQIALSRGAEKVFAATARGVRVWDGLSGHLLYTLPVVSGLASFAAFPEGRRVVAISPASADIWDASQAFARQVVRLHSSEDALGWGAASIAISSDGRYVAACGQRWGPRSELAELPWARVWDAATGRVELDAEGWERPTLLLGCKIGVTPLRTMQEELEG